MRCSPIRSFLWTLVAAALLAATARAQEPPPVGDLAILPGDAAVGTAVETQDWPVIAAGGPGYLVVWEDLRPVLCGHPNLEVPLCGNGWDIYAARLDADGNLLDPHPILIDQRGRNQTRPQVAWNGENWLVVWTTQRPEWYFFEDIVAKRVSPAGTVLDAEPLPIRLQQMDPAGDGGTTPSVTNNGSEWLVVWQDVLFINDLPYPTIAGRRIAADGSFLEPDRVTLHAHDEVAFGPREPQAAWSAGEYLVAWSEAWPEATRFKRFTPDLQPLDAQPRGVANAPLADITGNGTGFLFVTDANRAYRVNAAGQVLDAAGIGLGTVEGWQYSGPQVAWDGFDWTIVFSNHLGSASNDIYLARISTAGSVVEGPGPILTGSSDDWMPTVASADAGRVEIAWSAHTWSLGQWENVRGANVLGLTTPPVETDVSTGLTRQAWSAWATRANQHLVVFSSQGAGLTRVLAQRLAADGTPLDEEPLELTTYAEMTPIVPDVAFDGERYLAVWAHDGSVWGQRLDTNGAPLDAEPRQLFFDENATSAAVGGLAGNFLVAYTYLFSGDQQPLEGARVRGSDLVVLDTPFFLGYDFSLSPRIMALGDRWLVAWERQPSHDQSASSIEASFVSADGDATPYFLVNQNGYGDNPDIALAGDRVLVVWHDNSNYNEAAIEGRLIGADGDFLTPEFLIADDANDQFFPAAGFDGSQFVAAWTDHRAAGQVDQLRGDTWAARIDFDGNVLDPGGFQLTAGDLPEDLVRVAAADGKAVVAFAALAGPEGPEVQRLSYRVVGILGTMIFEDGFESGDTAAWDQVATQ